MVADGRLTSFECFTEDGEELTLRVLPCDQYGKPVRRTPNRPERREVPTQKADDLALTLFQRVQPSDIEQGTLGDCWFMSALAAIAEHPLFVRR